MSAVRFHKVRLNLPAEFDGDFPDENLKSPIYVDDVPILNVTGVHIDLSAETGFTVVTVSFMAKVEGEVEVEEPLLERACSTK